MIFFHYFLMLFLLSRFFFNYFVMNEFFLWHFSLSVFLIFFFFWGEGDSKTFDWAFWCFMNFFWFHIYFLTRPLNFFLLIYFGKTLKLLEKSWRKFKILKMLKISRKTFRKSLKKSQKSQENFRSNSKKNSNNSQK